VFPVRIDAMEGLERMVGSASTTFEVGCSVRRAAPIVLVLALMNLAASGAAIGQTPPLGDAAHGKVVFQQRCGLCHLAAPDDGDGGQGPSLVGVVGRKAGSSPEFGYTDALKASGRIWTPQALDAFLTAPSTVVPGTAMPMAVPNPKDRADLIAYLKTVK
jgi:cytochrome c2